MATPGQGYMPAAVARTTPGRGTPWVALLINTAAVSVLMLGDFESILEANMLTYNLKLVLEYAALIRLRCDDRQPFCCALRALDIYLFLAAMSR
jgi:amino acid transporter